MRSFLLAASLLHLIVGTAIADSSTCAVLFRQGIVSVQAGQTLQGLAVPPVSLRPAFQPGSLYTKRIRKTPAGSLPELARWYVAQFDGAAQRDTAVAFLRRHPDVEYVEAIRSIVLESSRQPALATTPWNVQQVGAPQALRELTPDSTLVIAVIDTGVDLTHPDLQAQLWDNGDAPGNASTADDLIDQNGDGIVEQWEKDDDDNNGYVDDQHGYDFTDAPGQGGVGDDRDRDPDPSDDHGHGTHVAGIIAAHGTLEGVAPFVRLMPVRAAYSTGFGGGVLETDDAAAAILYAVDNGAHILNLSWGDTVESHLIRAAIDYAVQQGVLVVAAVGNAGGEGAHWPAADPRVIGVGAAQRSGARSDFSNHGVGLDLLAPGEDAPFPGAGILSLEPRSLVPEGKGERRGTSMATPHVAGVAAIVMSRDDHPDAAMVRALLLASARRSGADWSDSRGHGALDAVAAVRSVQQSVLLWNGPSQPYRRGVLQARVSAWGATLQRFQLEAQHLSSGQSRILRPWDSSQYWNELLIDTAFATTPEGAWDLVLRAETTDGQAHERRMRFVVDASAAIVDTVFVQAAWHGRRAQWLLSAALDEPVSLRVTVDSTLVFGDAGFAARYVRQLQSQMSLGGNWTFAFENTSGLVREVQQPSPAVLPTWDASAYLQLLDETTQFLPESAWGQTPSGRTVVWGRGLEGGVRTTVQAWEVVQGQLRRAVDLAIPGRPVAYADINGDGRADLLLQNSLRAEWWITCDTCEFPTQRLTSVPTERVLGFFQLDDDAPWETILSSRDSLFLYDDATQGAPVLMQTIVNPSQVGFNFWGADAVAADLDGDGRIELVCGDGEGVVSVFESSSGQPFVLQQVIDTAGSYAYDLSAVPPDGFIVGRQRTQSVTGDGFATTLYEFQHYQHVGNKFTVTHVWPMIVPTGDLNGGSAYFRATDSLLTLVRGNDLYLLQRKADAWEAQTWLGGADGEAPIVADFAMAGNQLLLRTPVGAALYSMPSVRAPHDLAGESLGAGRLRLTWQPGDGGEFRLRRRRAMQPWQDIAQLTATTWIDSTAPPYVDHEYEVQILQGAHVVATSPRLVARSQPRPRLRALQVAGPTTLRCTFTNAIHPQWRHPRFFEVRQANGQPLDILTVNAHEEGRVMDLLLANELACDSIEVRLFDLRDTQYGLLDPPQTRWELERQCDDRVFLVRQVSAQPNGFRIAFSDQPASVATLPSTYTVYWNGQPQSIVSVQSETVTSVVLTMQEKLLGRGISYEVSIDPALQSVVGDRLQVPAEPYSVLWNGQGAVAVFVYPNPVRPGSDEVVFAEAAADTRVRIYNLEGELLQSLQEVRGGALRWNLQNRSGTPVGSGTYLYIATDSTGRSSGSIVVIR